MLTIIEKILYHNDCITAKTTMNIISINSNVDKIVIIDITNLCQIIYPLDIQTGAKRYNFIQKYATVIADYQNITHSIIINNTIQ